MEHKTQFSQFYEAFGNYSPGGVNIGGVSYLNKTVLESRWPRWQGIVDKLNEEGIIAASELRVVTEEEYNKLIGM